MYGGRKNAYSGETAEGGSSKEQAEMSSRKRKNKKGSLVLLKLPTETMAV